MDIADNDYAGFDEIPSVDDSQALVKMIDQLRAAEMEVAAADDKLKAAKETVKRLAQHDIPMLMTKMGMDSFTSSTGLILECKPDLYCSISEERAVAAHSWLEKNGHGGLIKREVAVSFARTQGDEAAACLAEFSKKFPGAVNEARWVEPQTLKAFLKGQLKEGKQIPMELFGASEFRVAKIKAKK